MSAKKWHPNPQLLKLLKTMWPIAVPFCEFGVAQAAKARADAEVIQLQQAF